MWPDRVSYPGLWYLSQMPYHVCLGWLGSAVVMGKFSMLGHPTYLDNSRARDSTGGDYFGHVSLIYYFSSFSLSLGDGPI